MSTATAVRLEIDYYARECEGIRYHTRTTILEVPEDFKEIELPFLLTRKVGKHHGIQRVRRIDG